MEADLALAGQDAHWRGEHSRNLHRWRGDFMPVLVERLLMVLLHILVGCVCAVELCCSGDTVLRLECLHAAMRSMAIYSAAAL